MKADQLIHALKKVLKARGLTYAAMAEGIGLSEASVKRLFSEHTFSLQRLEEICHWLELDFFELARLARGERELPHEMSLEQEKILASDKRLLGVFYLLRNNWTLEEIVSHYEVSEPECIRLLARLDKASLIELLPKNRVRLRVSRQIRHRAKGPIRTLHGETLMSDFLSVRFDEHEGYFRFEIGELSETSAAVLKRKMDRLLLEFQELVELDIYLPPNRKKLYGIAMGLRPWGNAAFIAGLRLRKK